MTAPDLRRDWAHLGRALRAARGGRSRAEVERLAGVSATQIKRYEAGLVTPPSIPDKMWMLAAFYGWTPDSIGNVLAGGTPTYVRESAIAEASSAPALSPGVLDKVLGLVSQAEGFTTAEKREFLRWLLAHET